MRLSLQARYAICGMFDLAYNGQGRPVQVRVVGERQAIPARYLEQIFQRLRRAGLVEGKRGPGGGYVLARPPAEIDLRQVLEAVEGPLEGGGREPDGSAPGSPHRPDFLWPDLERRVAELLSATTLEAICRDAARSAVPRSDADRYVYQI